MKLLLWLKSTWIGILFYLMYKLICQKPAHSLYAQMALASTFFPLFIVLGMFNFDPSIHSDIFFCDTTYNLIMNNPPLYLTALFCEFWLPVMWHIYSSETPTIRYFTNLITDFREKFCSPFFLHHTKTRNWKLDRVFAIKIITLW